MNALLQQAVEAIKMIYDNRHLLPQDIKKNLIENRDVSIYNFEDDIYGSHLTIEY